MADRSRPARRTFHRSTQAHPQLLEAGRVLSDGRAEVDPRDLQVCRNCGLHALCRIDERQPVGRWLEDGE